MTLRPSSALFRLTIIVTLQRPGMPRLVAPMYSPPLPGLSVNALRISDIPPEAGITNDTDTDAPVIG